MTRVRFSALAGYPSWWCYNHTGDLGGILRDGGITHKCCDQYENEGAPGVKWSGTFAQNVGTLLIVPAALLVNLSASAMIPRVRLRRMAGMLAVSLWVQLGVLTSERL